MKTIPKVEMMDILKAAGEAAPNLGEDPVKISEEVRVWLGYVIWYHPDKNVRNVMLNALDTVKHETNPGIDIWKPVDPSISDRD